MNTNIIEDNEKRNRLRYITYIIPRFYDAYKMNRKERYLYLKKYGGLDFLFEHWWALHTIVHFGRYAVCTISVTKMEVRNATLSRKLY